LTRNIAADVAIVPTFVPGGVSLYLEINLPLRDTCYPFSQTLRVVMLAEFVVGCALALPLMSIESRSRSVRDQVFANAWFLKAGRCTERFPIFGEDVEECH